MLKTLIRYLYRIKPEVFWEVATDDMIGTIPLKVTEPATSFLKTAGIQWEQWLMWISWKNQVRSMGDVRNKEAYLGMLFFIRWMYHLATKTPVKTEIRHEPPTLKVEEDPMEGVRDFMNGFSNKKK